MSNFMNPMQIRIVRLKSEGVDCFVFWSKNPLPMQTWMRVLFASCSVKSAYKVIQDMIPITRVCK